MDNISQAVFTYSRSIQDEIDTINGITVFIARWIIPIIFLLGFVTNILNIYVFTRPALRKNPCCLYLLASSVAALYFTIIVVPWRCLQYGYNIDPSYYSFTACKFKFFSAYTSRTMTVWYLTFACLDRFLHSSSEVKLRQLSNVKVAYYIIPLIFILVHLAYMHVLYFYIVNSFSNCLPQPGFYSMFLNIWQLATYGLAPPLIMLILCLLTIRHTRPKRVIPITNQPNQIHQNTRKDRNFFHMVFFQCLFVTSATMTFVAFQLYIALTIYQIKDMLQLAKDNLFSVIAGCISATGHTTTFFAFTLTSRLFRQQLFRRRQQRV